MITHSVKQTKQQKGREGVFLGEGGVWIDFEKEGVGKI